MILLAGFGPFEDLCVNPAEGLARRLDGSRILGHTVLGHVMAVSHERSVGPVVAQCSVHPPLFVLGVGVSKKRSEPSIEARARRNVSDRLDVDGLAPPLPAGPLELPVTLPAAPLATALGGHVSQDAGGYVCNGWLYRMLRTPGLPPVGFLHIPARGLESSRLRKGLACLVEVLCGSP